MQNVEDAVEMLGLFDGGDVGGLFDDTHQPLVARGAGAIEARINVGDAVAHRAETKIGFDVAHGGGKGFGVFVAGAQDVEGQTLGALGANAGKLFQLVDQTRHRFGKFGHGMFW